MTVEEHYKGESGSTERKPYRSTLVFAAVANGWTMAERGFDGPLVPAQVGDLTDAELAWKLDASGVPTAAPEEKGHGKPGVVANLSVFAFRPVGLVLSSTCTGESNASIWTDAAGRVRSVRFRVVDANDQRIQLHVDASVRIGGSTWEVDGDISVASDDGLTGEAQLHEKGPGGPGVNDRERVVRISRE